MTSLLRVMAIGATLFGLSTPAWAQGPSTTIVNNGNRNINIVVNIQGPTINVGVPGGFPGQGGHCNHHCPGAQGGPGFAGFGPSQPPLPPGFVPPTQNMIFNQGNGNMNQIHNRGGMPSNNQIVNVGNFNQNLIRNRGW
jgi:hypothetical protein